MMRTGFAYLFLLMGLCLGCAPRPCRLPIAPPGSNKAVEEKTADIWLKPKIHDFGTVKPGEELKLTLEVVRPEGTPLRLGRVMSPCTCVTVSAPKRVFAADETAFVYVAIKPDDVIGRQEYVATVEILEEPRLTVQTTPTFDMMQ